MQDSRVPEVSQYQTFCNWSNEYLDKVIATEEAALKNVERHASQIRDTLYQLKQEKEKRARKAQSTGASA